jgi:hypothetical protein
MLTLRATETPTSAPAPNEDIPTDTPTLPDSRSELAFADLIESAVLFAGIADPSRDPFIATLEVAPCGLDWAEQFAGQRFAIPRTIVNAATDDPTLTRTGILLWTFVPAF